ncbi:MAG: Vitamin B12 import ATP-binding protein BtuD [Hyphomicrobiaceae bacterium hypho_1]
MQHKPKLNSLSHYDTSLLLAELKSRQLSKNVAVFSSKNHTSSKEEELTVKKSQSFLDLIKNRCGLSWYNHTTFQDSKGENSAPSSTSLTFESISRTFDQTMALHDVSLNINAGELVCLLGPSGCGKTTLLRLASGIETPTSGRILLNNYEVTGPTRFVPPEKRNIGFMFQTYSLFPHLTVIQNVAYGLSGLSKEEANREALSALARIKLERFADSYPHILSGGQQQRVALARAVVPRPAVILMDEPFSGLDAHLRASLRQTTRSLLKETHSTAIIVTHDPLEAMQMADRIVVMKNGQILQVGHANELYLHPSDLFVARLFSEMNELEATVKNGFIEMPFGRFPASHIKEGNKVILCVRQRAIKPNWKGTHGRVLSTHFLSDLVKVDIGIEGLDVPLTSLIDENIAPSIGDNILIDVDPKGTMIFENNSSLKTPPKDWI